jgi:uracil-DNA glycosylase
MRWTERQRAMLAEMGIRLWQRADDGDGDEVATGNASGHSTPGTVDAVADAVMGRAATPVRMESPVAARPRAPMPMPVAPTSTNRASTTSSESPARETGEIARMDWPQLQAAVAECRACKLCQGRTQTVFGVGNLQAHWMIVGEAPGEQEDLQGEPFVGKSGQLLDNMLRAVRLQRAPGAPEQQVYIANTVKCRPPGNRNPEADELARCEPFLIRQVELVRPRIILAMGRFAVQSLLRSNEPIGRLRGRVHDYHGVPLIVTYHPAYLLRSPEEKARAWDDLCLAMETLGSRT